MGISDFGEMTRLAKIARPDTCVITNIGTCHLENLGDRDGVLKAKTEIFKYLKKDGHIVLNGDDDKLCTVKEYEGIKPVFFGMEADKDIYADEIVSRGLKGMTCRIHVGGESFVTDIPMPGRHMVYNALAATAVGRIYGLTLEQIRHGIETLEAISGRFHMIETDRFLIVDDCYNANPMSMKASLDVLKDGAGRRVAILGDMGELGENEVQLHAEVGEHAAQCGIDVCICTGALSANIAKEKLSEKYPDRKIFIVDSLGASSGYGLLMDTLAAMRKDGKTIEELYNWAEEYKLNVHHWFFSTDLSFYIKGGRISKTAGAIGSLLNICPLLNMDYLGRLIPRFKIRTKKKVIRAIVDRMEENAQDGLDYSGKCYISQSACIEDAKEVARLVEERFPKLNGKVKINYIGTTIGSHTGPGTVALFFWGKKRED